MFKRKEDPVQTALDPEIVRTILTLGRKQVDSPEYAKTLNYVTQLHAMRAPKPSPMSRDTLAIVGANLVGILLIIKHEAVNVVTSKALGLVIKPRI